MLKEEGVEGREGFCKCYNVFSKGLKRVSEVYGCFERCWRREGGGETEGEGVQGFTSVTLGSKALRGSSTEM